MQVERDFQDQQTLPPYMKTSSYSDLPQKFLARLNHLSTVLAHFKNNMLRWALQIRHSAPAKRSPRSLNTLFTTVTILKTPWTLPHEMNSPSIGYTGLMRTRISGSFIGMNQNQQNITYNKNSILVLTSWLNCNTTWKAT